MFAVVYNMHDKNAACTNDEDVFIFMEIIFF